MYTLRPEQIKSTCQAAWDRDVSVSIAVFCIWVRSGDQGVEWGGINWVERFALNMNRTPRACSRFVMWACCAGVDVWIERPAVMARGYLAEERACAFLFAVQCSENGAFASVAGVVGLPLFLSDVGAADCGQSRPQEAERQPTGTAK
eukprot:264972-Chlamydomonas_euryale.AAC.5